MSGADWSIDWSAPSCYGRTMLFQDLKVEPGQQVKFVFLTADEDINNCEVMITEVTNAV